MKGDQGEADGAESSRRQAAEPETPKRRGRSATRPHRFPLIGWRDILLRAKRAAAKDHLSIVAAGVAFFLLMGSVPALVALLSLYGLFSDPQDVRQHFQALERIMPVDAYEILVERMEDVSEPEGGAGLGAFVGIVLALWAGSRGTKGLMRALNIAYHEEADRGIVSMQLVSLGLTLAMITLGIFSVLLIAGLPVMMEVIFFASVEEYLISWLRWPILLVVAVFGLAIIYRHGPNRRSAQWKWVSTGAVAVTILWLGASAGFSFYVSNFGNFNDTYGPLGAVVVLLMWLYLTAYLILIGAEINAEMEHQTREDTTRGKTRPIGKRGAYVADHLGEPPE